MKKYIVITLVLIGSTFIGCKKFLDVKPLHKLSGNIYWKSAADVDAFTLDLYATFRNKITSTAFLPATGELRTGYILPTTLVNTNSAGEKEIRLVYNQFAQNNLRRSGGGVLDASKAWNSVGFNNITLWADFYKVIQGANIVCDQLEKGVDGVNGTAQSQRIAEAVFIRNLAYFFMVRIYGDVVYYKDAYNQETLPRENMVSVISKCIEDLNRVKNDLPVNYSDPVFKAVRATRGAAYTLLMHMNMWNAGFDKSNKTKYYEATASLGNDLIALNAYKLLPLEDFEDVVRGRSEEGIFEFNQSVNYEGQANFRSFLGEAMLKYPNKGATTDHNSSHAYYTANYLLKLYPSGVADKRKDLWFDADMLNQNGNFQFLKYKGTIITGVTGTNSIPEWGFIIFRYADAILLRAEALAELNQDQEAIKMLNLVRTRAQSEDYLGAGGEDLKNAIFIERSKELMGEGHMFFDLVRTNKIMDAGWVTKPLTQDEFNQGAWTWPIDRSALYNNPFMTLNAYWQ